MDGAIPLTKFRVPRLRWDTVPRATLLARLLHSVEANPLTIVRAPGGSGKTVLLSQLAAGMGGTRRLLWVALDSDDNDPNRFFAALCRAVAPLSLVWDADPNALAATVSASKSQMRAALAALVNALCTTTAERVVIVLDDLHRLDHPEVFTLLESLLERLPEHVTLVLGTRVEPPIALARWRAHGELLELGPSDLRFGATDAAALARHKLGEGRADGEPLVAQALERSDGWAVGLAMILQAAGGHAGQSANAPATDPALLFDYLAEEVLAELPAELRALLLSCSILDELDPALCEAVSGREDAGELLRELYRRSLFVTPIDETVPVLRFHDLFRDFLLSAAKRHYTSEELDALHVRAAHAETVPARAVAHYIEARAWNEALSRISSIGDGLLAEGALRVVENWFAQIPEAARTGHAEVAFLHGTCGWLRWDWVRAKRHLPVAITGLAAPDQQPRRVRALFQLVDALNSAGDLAGAKARLDEVARLPLDDLGRAQLALQRAWCLAPEGDNAQLVAHMHEFTDYAARDPERICPATAGLIHCMLVGNPGVADTFERFVTLGEQVRGPVARPWHLPLHAVDGWARIWRGDRAGADAAMARASGIHRQFRGIRLMSERYAQFRTLLGGVAGDLATTDAAARSMILGLQEPELGAHRPVWERAYRLAHARMHWIHSNLAVWEALVPALLGPRTPVEWPFVELAIQATLGQRALVARDWRSAIATLEPVLEPYERLRLPMIYCDPRISLATAHLRSGDPAAAWRVFEPVFQEATGHHGIGVLLMDARAHVAELLDATPPAVRASLPMQRLRSILLQWPTLGAAAAATAAGSDAADMGPLSEREREVLEMVASGASNKHIARALDLSLHTVKRHICNILDKLDCDSRGQAADWFRRTARA